MVFGRGTKQAGPASDAFGTDGADPPPADRRAEDAALAASPPPASKCPFGLSTAATQPEETSSSHGKGIFGRRRAAAVAGAAEAPPPSSSSKQRRAPAADAGDAQSSSGAVDAAIDAAAAGQAAVAAAARGPRRRSMPAAPSLGAFFTAAAPRPSTSWLVEPPSPRCPPRPSEAPPPRSAAFSYPKRRTSVGTAAPRAARRRKPRPRDGALAVAKVARPPKTLSPPRRAPAFVEALISLPGDDFDAGGDTEAYVDRMMSAAQEPYDDELRGDAPPASQAESEASTDGELSEASGPSDDEAAAAPPAAFIHTMVAARVEALDAAFSGPNTFSPRYEAVPRGDSLRRRRPPPRDAGPPHYDLLPPAAPPVAPLASMEDRRWRCPCGAALDYSVRAGHLADCSLFKDAWEEAHLDVVERLGVPAMRRLVGKVSMHHLCGEAEAFCALAHHGGDVHLAVGHLATADYRSEMQLAAETYDNTKLLAPKPRRKLVYYNRAPDAAEG